MEPIAKWAEAFGVEFRIEHRQASESRQSRTWFADGQDWCLQLTADTYVRFLNWQATAQVRDALSWTVFHVVPRDEVHGGEIDDVVEQLSQMDILQLGAQLNVRRNVFGEPATRWMYPGYLFVIDRTSNAESLWSGGTNALSAPWHHVIPDVFEAMVQSFSHIALERRQTSIVYVSTAQLTEAIADLPEVDIDLADVPKPEHLREIAGLVSTAIAEEAFLDARIVVSKRLDGRLDAESALASAMLALHFTDKSKATISVFGESPLDFIARLSEPSVRSVYWTMVSERSGKSVEQWPDEWLQMVDGLVRANLNVSEASRILYVHRNTLISRIERLSQTTGFDVRNVQDAMVLYVAALLYQQQHARKSD